MAAGVRNPSSCATPRSRSWSRQDCTRAWYSVRPGSLIGYRRRSTTSSYALVIVMMTSIAVIYPLGQFHLLVVLISVAYARRVRDRWSGLELRYLVTLAEVGRQASFSRAADALGYTQSAVSQQISRLEHVAGTRLVERPGGPRPVSLTPAGRLRAAPAPAIAARPP